MNITGIQAILLGITYRGGDEYGSYVTYLKGKVKLSVGVTVQPTYARPIGNSYSFTYRVMVTSMGCGLLFVTGKKVFRYAEHTSKAELHNVRGCLQ